MWVAILIEILSLGAVATVAFWQQRRQRFGPIGIGVVMGISLGAGYSWATAWPMGTVTAVVCFILGSGGTFLIGGLLGVACEVPLARRDPLPTILSRARDFYSTISKQHQDWGERKRFSVLWMSLARESGETVDDEILALAALAKTEFALHLLPDEAVEGVALGIVEHYYPQSMQFGTPIHARWLELQRPWLDMQDQASGSATLQKGSP